MRGSRPESPGHLEDGGPYQVRYRHDAKQVAKSFRTLSEAQRFNAKSPRATSTKVGEA